MGILIAGRVGATPRPACTCGLSLSQEGGSHLFSLCLWVSTSRCDLGTTLACSFSKLVINNKPQSFKDTPLEWNLPLVGPGSWQGRGKGCVPSTLRSSSGRVKQLAPGTQGAGFFTGGFRSSIIYPGPQLLRVASHSRCGASQWGSSLHLAMHVAPGPGWADQLGVCVLYIPRRRRRQGCGTGCRKQKGSIDSPPLHPSPERFPECSPLTTGDFGRTSGAGEGSVLGGRPCRALAATDLG